ncbi:MAG: phosphatidylserine decarboxylase family protein [Candidatus Brocadiales bacterium]|nr:phosphatidylserine decarboxylase family protein [Candidatus Bathyanammoxibius amoris]
MRMPITNYAPRELTLFTTVLLAGAVLSLLAGIYWAGLVLLLALGFVLFFFRDPERGIIKNESRFLAPADGRIVEVTTVDEGKYLKTEAVKVSIFMSIFDVHVNRIPCSGLVEFIDYQKGRFFDARTKEASSRNENSMIGLLADGGNRFLVKQIAGLVARRIVCPVTVGDRLEQGQRFGMVKFGSRLELFIPKGTKVRVRVKEGQKVVAGLTVLAELI